ncbi:nucleotidyltransferase family protein [Jiulongibacter sp. NS-SX5]|uniref:nucleotidyltransferase family protein n=1 Tax=Jiulongibacter sp. NS-SX5 TaxID=3463854 RepID=UPI0040590C50
MNVGIIILAAGEAKRMGVPKQLLDVNGKSMLQNVIDSALESSCYPVTIVLGAHKAQVVPALKDQPVNLVDNAQWQTGMASSIKMGMVGSYMLKKDLDAVIISTSDMPEISSSILKELIRAAEDKDHAIISSSYGKVKGVPALFKRSVFEELISLKGDEGARQIFQKYKDDMATISFDGGSTDLDTKEQYIAYLNKNS